MRSQQQAPLKPRTGVYALCLASLLAGALSLSACGGGDSSDPVVPPSPPFVPPTPDVKPDVNPDVKPDPKPDVDPDKPVLAKWTVSGTVTGLRGKGLVLRNNGGDDLAINGNGGFSFPHPVATGASYAVSVEAQPGAPAQTCTVNAGTGIVQNANVADVKVVCDTNAYRVTGTVTGLNGGGLVLQNNGGDTLAVDANGAFAFPTPITAGAAYAVTVLRPGIPAQNCSVDAPEGVVGDGDVTNVAIRCASRLPSRLLVPSSDGTILPFTIDPDTGVPAWKQASIDNATVNATSMAVEPKGRFVYGFSSGSPVIGLYSIGANGDLAYQGTLAKRYANDIAFDPSGRFAFVASDKDNSIVTYRIDAATGMLSDSGASIATSGPQAIAVDTLGRFLFAANTTVDTISVFAIDPVNGALRIVANGRQPGSKPKSIVLDPQGRFAYVLSSDLDNVDIYGIDQKTGSMTSIERRSLGQGTSALLMHPDGKHLYAVNVSTNEIKRYDIQSDGLIVPAQTPVPTGTVPISQVVDPSGRFAYIGTGEDKKLSVFTIDPITGAIAPLPGTRVGTPKPDGLAFTWK